MSDSKLIAVLNDELTKTLDTLHDLFDEIGLSSSDREGRQESIYSALNAALQEQLDMGNDEKETLTEQCQELILSIKQMEQALDDDKNGRSDDRVTVPLMKCLRSLKEKHDNVKKRHAERFASVRKLANALEQYASRLEPSQTQIPLPPTTNDPAISFDLSQSYCERLEAEYDRVYHEFTKRVAAVKCIAKDMVNLYDELGVPSSETDQSVVEFGATEPERLGLKKDDIERLRRKKEKLLDEKEERQVKVENLKNEIRELWGKLGVEAQERKSFMAQHRGYDSETILGLESELDRMLELKQEHLHVFVENARETLAELWEKLYFSKTEILYFSPAQSDVMSDSLLAAHESEIQRLQDLLKERVPIISLVDKHRSLIIDRESLATNDSSRLISRGGTGNRDPTRLLREEKTRKRIAKELPKVEAELKRALERWEDEYGEVFLVKGEDYLQTLKNTSTISQSRAGATSRQSTATPIGRARANTTSIAPGLARTLSRPGPVKPGPRSKTPSAQSLRSKTPTDRPTASTIGRSGGRSLALTNATTLHKPDVKTPGFGQATNALNKSPSKGALRSTFPNENPHLTQTVGRYSTFTRPLSTPMGPPKMQPLSRPKDSRLRARSEISLRSVSPDEHPSEEDNYTPASREVSDSLRSRQYSLTSSTTLTSRSGSENWETFAADSDEDERVDPKEAYYRNKLGYAEKAARSVVLVGAEDGWVSGEY